LDWLKSGRVLVSDGATGTNLQARGLERGAPAEAWLFSHTDQIVGLHRDFVNAGANIILTNTFGGSALRLKEANVPGSVSDVNRLGVELAREAIGDAQVLVAGSMGPTGQLLKPLGPLEDDQVSDSYAQQADALAVNGADLLVVETQFDLKEARLALEAIKKICNLPVVVSFSYDRGVRTMMGVTPVQMAEEFTKAGANVLGVNCGKSLDDNLTVLKTLRENTDLPIWFKPNAGLPVMDECGNTKYTVQPDEMGDLAGEWVRAGAQVIGGCCGTSSVHLKSIADKVRLTAKS